MKTFVQLGDKVDVIATGALAAGAGAQFGSLFGIAQNTVTAAGEKLVLQTVGVVDMVKAASQAWTFGQKIYWDNTAKVATNVVATNLYIGHAMAAVAGGAGDVVGRVRLHGAPA